MEFRKQEVEIILHCFYKELRDTSHLKSICKEVHLYKRKQLNIFNTLPFIVSSRISKELNNKLNSNNYPILIEGIHCTGFIKRLNNSKRKVALRTHNIEHDYYRNLKDFDNNPFKKLYYNIESNRLLKYETAISKKLDLIFPLSQKDVLYFKDIFKNADILYTSAFYNSEVSVHPPKNYNLLQGNFCVEENQQAAHYLINKVVSLAPDEKFIIAGKNANKLKVNLPKNVTIIDSPSIELMTDLNNEAKANIVYSNLNAGVKLKILNSLAAGVPVFCNESLYLDPYLKKCLNTYRTPKDLAKKLIATDRTVQSRSQIQQSFKAVFNLNHFAHQVIGQLFPSQK